MLHETFNGLCTSVIVSVSEESEKRESHYTTIIDPSLVQMTVWVLRNQYFRPHRIPTGYSTIP
jgi:hypothetical protein